MRCRENIASNYHKKVRIYVNHLIVLISFFLLSGCMAVPEVMTDATERGLSKVAVAIVAHAFIRILFK